MPPKHKIVHIITRLDKGGSAENTRLTVSSLDKEKYEVILVKGPSLESKMSKEEYASLNRDLKEVERKGVRLVNNPFLLRRVNLVYDLLALFSLYLFLAKERPTIVHTHTSKAGLVGRFAARLARVPIIVHTPHGHVFFGYFGAFKTKLFIFWEKLASRITDKMVALTNTEKEDHLAFGVGSQGKFVVIPSGVELDKFKELSLSEKQRFKKELGIPEKALIVGTVGRLVPVKGPEILLDAAARIISRYPSVFFVFIGDGHLRKNLERKASLKGIRENIMFLGWRSDAPKIMSIYDVFVLPSLNEGMGRVLVEAMALSKPIVASNVGGIPDLVIQGKNGFLVLAKKAIELAKHIQILIEDKGKRESMGQEGRKMAVNFSRERMVKKIAELYKQLIGGKLHKI